MAMRQAVFWWGFALLISIPVAASADLDTEINRAILEATTHDTSRTNEQKLFENRCETIAATVGFEENVTGQARRYSCEVNGIGITLYAGADLGNHLPEKVGKYFGDALAEKNLPAQVFIERDHEHGSSMAFYVDGQSWNERAIDPLSATEQIDALVAETNLILLTRGRIDQWISVPERVN